MEKKLYKILSLIFNYILFGIVDIIWYYDSLLNIIIHLNNLKKFINYFIIDY